MRITVEHFGPIVHADIEVKPLTLLIGREATGKSTLAKLVYFGQAIPELILANY